jgi:hypothetical protein
VHSQAYTNNGHHYLLFKVKLPSHDLDLLDNSSILLRPYLNTIGLSEKSVIDQDLQHGTS